MTGCQGRERGKSDGDDGSLVASIWSSMRSSIRNMLLRECYTQKSNIDTTALVLVRGLLTSKLALQTTCC